MWIQTFDGDLINGDFVQRIVQEYGAVDDGTGLTHIRLYAILEGPKRILLDDSSTIGSPRTQDDIQNYIENSLGSYLFKLNYQYI